MKRTELNLANSAHAINARNRELSILIDSMPLEDSMYIPLLMHDWNAVMAVLEGNSYPEVITFMNKYFN